MNKKIVLVNQTANYLFADIIHAFAERLPDYKIEAWYGTFDHPLDTLPQSVALAQGPSYNRETFSKRLRSWLAFFLWLRKMLRGENKQTTRFFFVSNPPLFVFLPGLKKLNYACLIYDLYPDVLSGFKDSRIKKAWQSAGRKGTVKYYPKQCESLL